VRSEAGAYIRNVCAKSAFGLLCPEIEKPNLDAAMARARARITSFNAEAKLSWISLNVIAGRIAADDVEAVKAINSEVAKLMALMQDGIRNCDAKAVRDAANKAREVGQMLTGTAQARVKLAIDTARDAAKAIVKAAESSSKEIDRVAIAKITEQRTAFLDLDGGGTDVAAPAAEGRAIDLDTAVEPPRNNPMDGYQPDSPALEIEPVIAATSQFVADAVKASFAETRDIDTSATAATTATASIAAKPTRTTTKRKTKR
jgi:hypothetical protein